jgi:uncharacterized membrane protein
VADRGLNRVVTPAHWQSLTSGMAAAFRADQYEHGLNGAVDSVGVLLDRHFSVTGQAINVNELPDAPDVR